MSLAFQHPTRLFYRLGGQQAVNYSRAHRAPRFSFSTDSKSISKKLTPFFFSFRAPEKSLKIDKIRVEQKFPRNKNPFSVSLCRLCASRPGLRVDTFENHTLSTSMHSVARVSLPFFSQSQGIFYKIPLILAHQWLLRLCQDSWDSQFRIYSF